MNIQYKQFRSGSNYAYLFWDETNKDAAVFDPIAPNEIMRDVREEGLHITSLFNTHWHSDHTSGNDLIKHFHEEITTFGHPDETRGSNRIVKERENMQVGDISITAYFTPGHTETSISFIVGGKFLICGDTLFHAGCGNCHFGGNVETLYNTLNTIYSDFDDDLIVLCGHDYTDINFPFSMHIFFSNTMLKQKYASIQEEKQKGNEPFSTLGEERRINPFLNAENPQLQKDVFKMTGKNYALGIDLFRAVRELKDNF